MTRFIVLVVLLYAQSAFAQSTVILSDAGKATWVASTDHNATFGSPPMPVLTSYRGELWPKSAISCTGTPLVCTQTGPPVITIDLGKPTPDAANVLSSPPLKPLIQPNIEYVLFLSAVGPGGTSAKTPVSVPFGFPSAPRPVASAVSIIP